MPIAVTRSSLDALEADAGGDREIYLARAREGLERLDRILTRMSEASRLEQALGDTDRERFDVAALVAASAIAYAQVWPDTDFAYSGPSDGVEVLGSADLLAQALDKLVANARDFHQAGTPVALAVEPGARRVSAGEFDLKQDSGGLADIEFLVDYWVLANAEYYPELVEFPDNIRQLEALERTGLVAADRCKRLIETYIRIRERLHELALAEQRRVVPQAELAAEREWVTSIWEETFADNV